MVSQNNRLIRKYCTVQRRVHIVVVGIAPPLLRRDGSLFFGDGRHGYLLLTRGVDGRGGGSAAAV